jgi:putative heme-binding domain-containing protein
MRKFLLSLLALALATVAPAKSAEPFEIKDGDRVLFLGDTLLEREGTYGYLETRMAEQFPDRKFTVRNLAFSADTPLGWSRASFDPPAKGFERLKEQLDLVKPTVVFLGYGMAASLQEMTDRSQDWTLNRDPARYGAEPMSAARFKGELAQLMDAIVEGYRKADTGNRKGEDGDADASKQNLSGIRYPVSGIRFVLLSPIRHEDLRATRPGLPDPTEHNKLLEQYSKAIEELAKERGARFVSLAKMPTDKDELDALLDGLGGPDAASHFTDNGIHLTEVGYAALVGPIMDGLGWNYFIPQRKPTGTISKGQMKMMEVALDFREAIRPAIIRKNALFFHRWRPANETYLFGFRKREQGQNAAEIPKFDPLIEAAEAEIEKLKRAPKGASAAPASDDAKTAQAGTVSAMPDPKSVMTVSQSVMADSESVMADSKSVMADSKSVMADSKSVMTDSRSAMADSRSAMADSRSAMADSKSAMTDLVANNSKSADFRPKPPVFTSTGQLYAANDTPATGNQPPVTSHQSPVTAPDPARQTPAETPDLSKVAASPSTLPHPDFVLADGLEISLWAENPLLAKPTEVNWDAQGRLWVASSALYPMIAPGQVADDKILVIEDPGHTGKGTKSTVFADGLLVPTGVAPVLVEAGKLLTVGDDGSGKPPKFLTPDPRPLYHRPARWGCYVGQSTELLYFEDTTGTGKADKKRIVFSGFGTEDTHHIVHTLRWGPDGRLYFSQSVYIHTHMETPWGVVRVNSGGVFAYDPRTERVEVVEKGLWNTWGHAWDKWGQPFYTDGAGSTGLSWGFPGATFAPNEGARRTMASISPGSYPKFAGLELIYSPHFPADWQGTAVTNDFRAHKVVHFKINDLSAEGKSGYVTDQLPVLVQTSDATFRPIDVKLGPDGALYIADWSNPIINHGEVDFRDPRRDHEHGRIWRLSMKGGAAVKWESLVGKKTEEIIAGLLSENQWSREQARRVLRTMDSEKRETVLKDVLAGLSDRKDDSSKRAYHRALLELVWLNCDTPRLSLADLARFPGIPRKANTGLVDTTASPETFAALIQLMVPAVERYNSIRKDMRDQALQKSPELKKIAEQSDQLEAKRHEAIDKSVQLSDLIEERGKQRLDTKALEAELDALWTVGFDLDDQLKKTSAALQPVRLTTRSDLLFHLRPFAHDAHPRVRVEAMRALARIPTLQSASLILDAAIKAPKDDPQYEFAAWLSINDLAEVWTKAVLAGAWKPEGREKQLEFALDALDAAHSGPVIAALLKQRPVTRDGAGPWIELIGKGGGSAELQGLFERVAKGDLDQPALVRAMNALATAARLRNLRPEGSLAPVAELIDAGYADTRTAAARLAGLWHLPEAASRLEILAKHPAEGERAAAFEGLRSLGGAPAVGVLQKLVRLNDAPSVPPAALAVLAQLKPGAAIAAIPAVLGAIKSETELLATWRGIFQSKGAVDQLTANFPANLPKPAVLSALRAARELGRQGERLVAKLTPLTGGSLKNIVPSNYADLAARAKKDGDAVAGEAIYRRTASACTTCHAIGGAGGKLGPDLTSIGASAPPDYIIESVLDPAAKVKEGYHAFAFAMKDGTEAIGIPSRETPQEQFIRTLAGEQGLPKANIVSKKLAEGGASLMPVGLTAAWTDRERLNLYAFLMELGRPGPFDASKNNVARVWQLADSGAADGALKPDAAAVTLPAYTLVDGRLTKDLLAEKLAILQPKNAAVHLTARFQAANAGKAKLNLTGIRKAWLDGQPLAIASEPSPSVDLSAGAHTFTVEVDAKSPPDVLRLESPAASFLGD